MHISHAANGKAKRWLGCLQLVKMYATSLRADVCKQTTLKYGHVFEAAVGLQATLSVVSRCSHAPWGRECEDNPAVKLDCPTIYLALLMGISNTQPTLQVFLPAALPLHNQLADSTGSHAECCSAAVQPSCDAMLMRKPCSHTDQCQTCLQATQIQVV